MMNYQRRGGRTDGNEGDLACELGRVGATKGEFAVVLDLLSSGLECDRHLVRGDGALAEEVVRDGWDGGSFVREKSIFSEIYWPNTEDTVDSLEAFRNCGGANRLPRDVEPRAKVHGVYKLRPFKEARAVFDGLNASEV